MLFFDLDQFLRHLLAVFTRYQSFISYQLITIKQFYGVTKSIVWYFGRQVFMFDSPESGLFRRNGREVVSVDPINGADKRDFNRWVKPVPALTAGKN